MINIMIDHGGKPLSYTPKNLTDPTDLTDSIERPRRGTRGILRYDNLTDLAERLRRRINRISIVCKPYRPRGNFPRSVRLFRLKNAHFIITCYVRHNTKPFIIKEFENRLCRPRKILEESAKSVKSAMFLKGSRGPGFSMINIMISHDRKPPSHTLKHFADLADSADQVENSVETLLLPELCRLRGKFPRSAKLVLLNLVYFMITCYVIHNSFMRSWCGL